MAHADHFEFSSTVSELLFQWIQICSAAGLFLACAILALVAVLYEGIRLLRGHLMMRSSADRTHPPHNGEREPLRRGNAASQFFYCSYGNIIQSALHMAQMFVGYLLMLSIMTYNAWLLIAILVGAGFSSFALKPLLSARQPGRLKLSPPNIQHEWQSSEHRQQQQAGQEQEEAQSTSVS